MQLRWWMISLVAWFGTELLFWCQNWPRWDWGVPDPWWAALSLPGSVVRVGYARLPSMVTPGTASFFLLGLVRFVVGSYKGLVVFSSTGKSPLQKHTALPSSQQHKKMLWGSQGLNMLDVLLLLKCRNTRLVCTTADTYACDHYYCLY